jgi:RNA polymerase sigma factor (sigma-70 family)
MFMRDRWKRKMCVQEPDSALEALDEPSLRARLARTDWEHDVLYVPDEQVFRLFRRSHALEDKERVGLLARILSTRILRRAKVFAVHSGIYPGKIGNLDQAAEELAQFIWECLITRPGDAAHAEKYFGQQFKRRALDFQRRLLAKKRNCQDSLDDAMKHLPDDEDPEQTIRVVTALRQIETPYHSLEAKQMHAQVASRLQAILTKEEHFVYVMLFVDEMLVKDIALALDVTTRTVNNYKNAALKKVQKEFKK